MSLDPVAYHLSTKHGFNRFARSAGYLDWANQPDPFRRYEGTDLVPLSRAVLGGDVPFQRVRDGTVPPGPVDLTTIGQFLRCSLGLSAWKSLRETRWPLRVNPSSGNLHPTEAYVVWDGQVAHYAAREHALEVRTRLDGDGWDEWRAGGGFLVGLTSIAWRESWKYGERAFRYCQHDVGHALGALRYAAALFGWKAAVLPRWSDDATAAVLGIDRAGDYDGAERELAECVLCVTPGSVGPEVGRAPDRLVAAAHAGSWRGRANQLSKTRTDWEVVEAVAEATLYPGRAAQVSGDVGGPGVTGPAPSPTGPLARQILLQRRSAVAFDPRGWLARSSFAQVLARLKPVGVPWDVADWPACAQLALFVHRVEDVTPGLYAFVRDPAGRERLREAMRPEFLWEPASTDPNDLDGLYLLVPSDVTWTAARLSCDQDIAAECSFSLGMLVPFASTLGELGAWAYRRLFWECGLIGQVLYLEAEAAGVRGTGIGCYYDDAVHDLLGLTGVEWQSFYHFAFGVPIEDARLTTEPGYSWEREG
ncbi:MAG TPA: SagB/ThcOx family dehydrogenase [Vicinamibacterales bacterium]